MADRHPYVTAPGYLVQVITQFKKSFPQIVTADTLKKLGFAPQNESYILNILRYLGYIDQDGNKTPDAVRVFSLYDKDAFAIEFGKKVTEAYNDLFDLHGEDTWDLDTAGLITFFRSSDGTTDRVGKLQASTFHILASFSGHGEVSEKSVTKQPSPGAKTKPQKNKIISLPAKDDEKSEEKIVGGEDGKKREIGLTVRIEINLPADGTQETYDRIFKSIRENLLDG